ncbi:hypothetical protein WICPIJ_000184 [Wickerhamomyces pijperi]|uniref:Protein phosphatase n=1 Tax=Wickerhamomyces pijperi TaxID=599730 RepID=A0A9P8QHQ6_WICPI|nr:hypothetical protein WICPIJ_000184 [Wickerhamomyces pijperi]
MFNTPILRLSTYTRLIRQHQWLSVVLLTLFMGLISIILTGTTSTKAVASSASSLKASANLRFNSYVSNYSRRFTTSSSHSSSSSNSASSAAFGHSSDGSSAVFKYNVAVAFQPKDRDENKLLKSKSKEEPSPTGEDNYFTFAKSDSELACGVADGVGGWNELGYDSSAISRELCKALEKTYAKDNESKLSPKEMLSRAFKQIQEEKIVQVGGTTSCFGTFNADGRLSIANLGDSWCGVFRQTKLIHETRIQTHQFNTPFQLAIIPESILNQQKAGSRFIMDTPRKADEYSFQLQKGDIVVFATDGVIDNIAVQDIELYLDEQEGNPDFQEVASKFVKNVVNLSKDERFPSVFSQELSKLTGQFYSGGKEDDITAVFVKVE